MGKMTKRDLALALHAWEYDNGESVLEYGFAPSFSERDFMKWCLAIGKIDQTKYDLFMKEAEDTYGEYEFHQIVFDTYGDYDYAVVTAGHLENEDGSFDYEELDALRLTAYEIFAEYVLTFPDGQERWEAYVKETA